MPDGAAAEREEGGADGAALDADARLIRDVRRRLVVWSGGSTLVVLLVLGALLYAAAARSLEASGTRQLQERAADLRAFVAGPDRRLVDAPIDLAFGGGSSGTVAVIVGPTGRPVGRRILPIPAGLPEPSSVRAARERGRDVRATVIAGIPVRVLSEAVRGPGGGEFVVQVVGDRTAEQRTLGVLLAVLVGGGLVAVVVAAGFGTAYARRALVPIRDSLAAQRSALWRQRRFAADASHELRTPLTVIRSSVEHLRRHRSKPVESVGEALDDIDAEVAQLTALVDDLLLLARADSGAVALAREPVDLGDLAASAASGLATAAAARRVSVVVDPAPAFVEGDAVRLRQLVAILVDNAIGHAREGGSVRVAVRADGRIASLVVDDDGRGVRPEDLPHLFDRFWRAPGSPRAGTGLGLSIASWIVERHGGRIAAANRPDGGARFSVELPSLATAPPGRRRATSSPAADGGAAHGSAFPPGVSGEERRG